MAVPFLMLNRCFSSSSAMTAAIKNVTIIGGGLMGSGIAQVAAQTGHQVTIVEVNEDALKKAQAGIQTSLQRVAKKLYKDKPADGEKFVKDTLSRLNLSMDLTGSVKNTDIVIEAIVENIDIKHKLFSTIDR
ncbi:hypothetical protein L9F63_026906 [Diploptera punctata]|uniref:3-hydroxyacyl-CoA dehydrogenase NAD binding domain-containing protein n=1 Tax=Diploptera punctata TaxID=6984 RepID=A0AAD8EQ65_DIPPU|nr:hypothetical protein L9F63_026906 [Diploptera punctata]